MTAFSSVIRSIGEAALQSTKDAISHKIIVNKSTVPIGTARLTEQALKQSLSSDQVANFDQLFSIVSMPEFLAEGQAIDNLIKPERIVIGTPNT